MRNLFAAALLILAGARSQAQTIRPDHKKLAAKIADPELRALTEQALQRNDHYYEQEALDNQARKGENFTYTRVEVTGVMSNDDTGEFDPNLFEEQIKPSFLARENMNSLGKAIEDFRRFIDPKRVDAMAGDSFEYTMAARGQTTDNAKKKLTAYHDAEINELVAHSWGCELVYAAILNGDIPPPKKLIVVGVPDNDRLKWDMLARYTGTEVHWVRAENDVVRYAQGSAEAIGLEAGSNVDFLSKWEAVCAFPTPNKRICNAHGRESKRVIVDKVGNIPGLIGHNRMEYYAALKKSGVLKNSHQQLRHTMMSDIEAETERVKKDALADALAEARGLVVQARRLRETPQIPEPAAPAVPAQPTNLYLPGIGWVPNQAAARPAPAVPGQPLPAVPQAAPPEPFSSVFPRLRDFAVSSCNAPDRIPNRLIFHNLYDMSYGAHDDARASVLSSGLDDCSRRLFNKIIEWTRRNKGFITIDGRWTRDEIASYSKAPQAPAGNTAPYSGGGGQRGGSETTPPPATVHDPEGEALRQLKAIEDDNAMRKRWGLTPRR